MSYRSLVAFLVASGVTAASFFGCSASGSGADVSDSDPTSPPGAPLPPPASGSSGGDDTSHDAGKDAKAHDASTPDAGPPPPSPGDACAKTDTIYSRACGACGKQEAICQATGDGGALVVSDYSACHDEIAGGCTPGASVTESCGNCGTHTKTCSKYCAWSVTTCTGEPVDSCPAGTVAWTPAGCPTTGTFRSRACSDTCTWQTFAACSAPDYQLRVPKTVGGTARIVLPLTSAIHTKRVQGACGHATLSTENTHAVAWVRVVNDSGSAATLSAWNEAVTGSPTIPSVLASYTAQPASDADLQACEKGAGDSCPATLPCGDPTLGSLTGSMALVIPNGETRIVGVTAAYALGTVGEASEGSLALVLRSDALN